MAPRLYTAGSGWRPGSAGEADLDAPVVAALVVDVEEPDRWRLARRRQVRAAARLAVEPGDLDDPDRPIGLGRWRDRSAPEEPALGPREVGRHVDLPDRQVLADRVVDRGLER